MCRRCERSSKKCEYRSLVDVIFHDDTRHAARRATELWQKRSTKPIEVITADISQGRPSSSEALSLRQTHVTIPLLDLAMQRFFFDYVFRKNPSKARMGYLEHLPELCENREYFLPYFESAIKATILANFARRYNSVLAEEQAMKQYTRAIQLINQALGDSHLVWKNETLLACHLLGICEVKPSRMMVVNELTICF